MSGLFRTCSTTSEHTLRRGADYNRLRRKSDLDEDDREGMAHQFLESRYGEYPARPRGTCGFTRVTCRVCAHPTTGWMKSSVDEGVLTNDSQAEEDRAVHHFQAAPLLQP
jgi:hypothetical protein